VTPYARTFPCPNCNEMISENAAQCRFCSVPIDAGVAELSARKQEQVNQACSDASYLRATAVAIHVFLVASLVFGMVFWAFVITFWLGVFLLIRWQLNFSNLQTNDPDFPKARRSKNIAALLVLAGLPLGLILNPFVRALLN
jgi:Flp pilus assembly protein TadB